MTTQKRRNFAWMKYFLYVLPGAFIASHGDLSEAIISTIVGGLIVTLIAWLTKRAWNAREKRIRETPKGPKKIVAEKMKELNAKERTLKIHNRESQEIMYQFFMERLHWFEKTAHEKQEQWKYGQYQEDREEAFIPEFDEDSLRTVGGGLVALIEEAASANLSEKDRRNLIRHSKNLFNQSVKTYVESQLGWCYQYTPNKSTEWKHMLDSMLQSSGENSI